MNWLLLIGMTTSLDPIVRKEGSILVSSIWQSNSFYSIFCKKGKTVHTEDAPIGIRVGNRPKLYRMRGEQNNTPTKRGTGGIPPPL